MFFSVASLFGKSICIFHNFGSPSTLQNAYNVDKIDGRSNMELEKLVQTDKSNILYNMYNTLIASLLDRPLFLKLLVC